MELKEYYNFGMRLFELFVESEKRNEANREAISEFIGLMSEAHLNVVEKYGPSRALNTVFAGELGKYYDIFSDGSFGDPRRYFLEHVGELDEADEVMPYECLIIYPSFIHRKVGETSPATAHIPTIRGYILHQHSSKMVNVDYSAVEFNKEPLKDGLLIPLVNLISDFVAKEWGKGYSLTKSEEDILSTEINTCLLFDNDAACKLDIINYLVSDVSEKFERLLRK